MNTDFAKLLNNCLNRMDGKDDDTDKNDVGRDTISEKVEISNINNSPVRSEIKDIIEEKIKKKGANVGSPVLEKVEPIQNGASDFVELEEASEQAPPDKAKILFSLKDFFERSKESENNADNLSSGEESNDAPSDLDKNVESLYNDDQSEDGDSDVISDDSDLEEINTNDSTEIVEDSTSDKESDIEDKKGEPDDDDSDLESELNLLEKLKQKLDDSITSNPKDDSVVLIDELNKKIEDVKKIDDGNDDNEKGKDELCSKTDEKLGKDSDTDPIKINDDIGIKDAHEQDAKKGKQVKSMFKNISISLVGANSKSIDLESLLKKSSSNRSSSPAKQTQNVFQKPNISVKRKSGKCPELVLSGKRFKKSSIILSSDEDSPRKESVPTVTLDENTIEDISDDEKENIPKENVSSQYDNCTHGDPMDYMCVECTFNRWRCEWDFVKPVRVKKIKKPVEEEVNPVEIIQAVNWEKVFKFAGVGVE